MRGILIFRCDCNSRTGGMKVGWSEPFNPSQIRAKTWQHIQTQWLGKGLVKGAILCFRNPYFYFRLGESTSTASQLTSPASQKSKDLYKVLLLLQDLALTNQKSIISNNLICVLLLEPNLWTFGFVFL